MISADISIRERCGIEDIDTISQGLLVRVPLNQVAEVLAQSAVRWERNIYDKTIQGCGLLVFQFLGHAWTGILDGKMTNLYREVLSDHVISYWNWRSQAEFLSQRLQARVIYYKVSDSSGGIGYTCWDNGSLMEHLEFDEAIWQDTHDETLWDESDRPFEPHLFESQLRQLTAAEIEDAYAFVDDFLCEQQAFAATSLGSIQRDDFVRIDYIAFA